MAVSPDGRRIVSGSEDTPWRSGTSSPDNASRASRSTAPFVSVAWHLDGHSILAGDALGISTAWSTASREPGGRKNQPASLPGMRWLVALASTVTADSA